jgi:hypothetical protein
MKLPFRTTNFLEVLLGDAEAIIMVNMLHRLNSKPTINAINNNLENLKIIGTPFSL